MPGRLFINAKVFTGRGEDDFASAFRIDGGRFSWVGGPYREYTEPADIPEAVRDVPTVDLEGATVVPGFLDVHQHPVLVATLAAGPSLMPPLVRTIPDIIKRLRYHADLAPENEWILGWGYDEMYLTERRQLTRKDLDLVSRDRPVFVRRSDLHTASCNSVALRMAGITRDTPDPEGARFERHSNGEPNGILTEFRAVEAVASAIPPMGRDHLIRELLAVGDHLTRHGIVGVGDDLAAVAATDILDILREAQQAGFAQHVNIYLPWTVLSDEIAAGNPRVLTDDDRFGRIKIAGTKVFVDGAISNATAWMARPYRGTFDQFGRRTINAKELRAAAEWARDNRVQLAAHAMGDAALEFLIDVVGDMDPWMTDVPSVQVEHASILPEPLQQLMLRSRMNFGIVTHSIFDFAEMDVYSANLSTRALVDAYPLQRVYRSFHASCLSSDSPATTWMDADNVFTSIQAAVDRTASNGTTLGFANALTIPQAILMYTSRAVRVAPHTGLGRIAQGAFANFVILDRDVFTTPAKELGQVRVASTWIDGERVYRRDT
ncbi:amidohydrolase [Dermatophilus congolensis]|uniref:N-substituted formamide deformylase n=1 Tax=Dermatophilus congolensis TaxID=1863 RepID=A0A239V9B3_9MICO|nr:amidohydrolase family protein [Dermatophilus congolensis]MBO3130562.1 amidohydrolase family protein [Dermatophilus congolensis]MBO3130808.1 amidohydrolase family protein [Dermatophilus congolensis]MBO3135035.1 amidohydrolase family protein [Dermatophilus congolensis]MBO3137274.1 amidohydrolase family protein [Dermatophilus congolensis]MBO3139518.1 amidohydrolase family protein [Dermatophilus congolensis]